MTISSHPDPNNTLPDSCDVLIIGAGVGGLTAGAILAKAGLHTVILEAAKQPGGYLAGFKRKGFKFDTSIHWLSQCGPGGSVRNIFNHIGHGMPECPQLHRIHRFKGDTFDYTLTSEPLVLRDQLSRDFPSERVGITRFFDDARKLGDRLDRMNYRVQNIESMSPLGKAVFGMKMLAWVLPVLRHLRSPVDKGLANYFKSQELRAIFNSQESFMSVIVPVAWAFTKNFQAAPTGGSSTIIHWLCSKIVANGSQVILRQRVEKILIDDHNTVTGVLLAGGHKVFSSYIIAACDIQVLYNRMLPEQAVPSYVKNAVNRAELHDSCFTLFLGLDCDPTLLGFGEEVLNLTTTNPNRADHVGGDPHRSIIMVVSSSVRDPSMAPPGKGSIMIQCPASMGYMANWATEDGLARGQAYRDLKAQFADIILDRVENAVAPDLRKHIEVMETASPITYWRYTANTGGTTLGSKPTAKNIKTKVSHYKTPIKKLFIGGHCAEYGGGVPLAVKAGANSSLLILKDLKHPDFNALKRVLAGKK
ncbi:MAG: NAD(P)/FAD-dependent oxidoreductase [Proteobacteria bacterium]|nr:NAD(P)/FAD-dependent oxidoreductase [Pseudomonadota bacterium]MBU1687714.1 NAD(P)/FAD-dependent oxidoreductase [Pseudomonadota bacterium]